MRPFTFHIGGVKWLAGLMCLRWYTDHGDPGDECEHEGPVLSSKAFAVLRSFTSAK